MMLMTATWPATAAAAAEQLPPDASAAAVMVTRVAVADDGHSLHQLYDA